MSHWSNRIYQPQDSNRIPPYAWIGAIVFVIFWLGLFNLGAAAGF